MNHPRFRKSSHRWQSMDGYMWVENNELVLEHGRYGDCADAPSHDYIQFRLTKDDLRAILSRAKKILGED